MIEYLRYWSLRHSPFAAAPTFFYAAVAQRNAIAEIQSLVSRGIALGTLAAPSGCGMTTLLRYCATLSGFGDRATEVFLTPGRVLTKARPVEVLVRHLELPRNADQATVSHVLTKSSSDGIRTVWLIDDCPSAVTSAIQTLVNQLNCLTVIVGSKHHRLATAEPNGIRLKALTRIESGDFVTRSLTAAGRMSKIFDASAIRQIHQLSGGRIKLICEIAEDALIFGCNHRLRTIDARQISKVRTQRQAA